MDILTSKEISIAFIQLIPIIVIWVRIEKRLSTLEGRFQMYMDVIGRVLSQVENRR